MTEFKAGDRVKILQDCTGCTEGEIAVLFPYPSRPFYLYARGKNPRSDCTCKDNWELLPLVTVTVPKLKVGDTFYYSKEMCDRWQDKHHSIWGIMPHRVGQTSVVNYIDLTRSPPCYGVSDIGSVPIDVVDHFMAEISTSTNTVPPPLTIKTLEAAKKMLSPPGYIYQYVQKPHVSFNPKNLMRKLTSWMKRNFSPTQKTLYKAGFIESDGMPTTEGHNELDAILWQEKQKELVAAAEEKLKEEKENCK